MPVNTPNYNLVKPSAEEFYDVNVPNANMDKIDAALKALSDALGGIDLTTLSEAINAVDNKVTEHLDDKENPHGVTTEQIGAVTVQDFSTHLEVKASLTTSGHAQLSNAFDSTSDTLAATPSAVKQAYDRGDSAFNNEAELRAEFNAFKSALTEGFTNNQFSDGLSSLNAFNVIAGYYNLPMTRLEV